MKTRCSNPNDKHFDEYGGRGIKVCDRWLNSFENFLADMGEKPSPSHSIDRIKVNGNYEPGNCRWATPEEQARNKRDNRLVTYHNETKCVTEWARELGVWHGVLIKRLNSGMSVEQAFDVSANYRLRLIEYQGRSQSLAAWGRETGINASLIRARIEKGWSIERALTEPVTPSNKRRYRTVVYHGQEYGVNELARLLDMPKSTVLYKLNKGVRPEDLKA